MRRRNLLSIAMGLILAIGGTAGPVAAQNGRSAYQQLSDTRLGEALAQQGMTELMEHLSPAGNVDAKWLLAQAEISKAAQMADLKARDAKLVNAAKLLGQIITATDGAEGGKLLEHYRYRLKLAEVIGIYRPEPYVFQKIMALRASPNERKAVTALAALGVKQVDRLQMDMGRTKGQWRSKMEMIVRHMADLEQLEKEALYRGACMRFFCGLATNNATQREMMLKKAVQELAGFIKQGKASGVADLSLLMTGMSQRLLGDYEKAIATLETAAGPSSSLFVRTQAWFDIALTYIQWGKYDQAERAIQSYARNAENALGKKGKAEVDLKVAMLGYELYATQAAAATDAGQATAFRQKAVDALMAFLEKHPEFEQTFVDVVLTKFAGEADSAKQPTIALWAKAVGLRRKAQMLRQVGGSPEQIDKLIAEASSLVKEIQARSDALSKLFHSRAMWEQAMLYSMAGDTGEAGKTFLQFSKQYPDSPQALTAGRNAIICYIKINDDRIRQGKPMTEALRRDFIAALQWVLGKWGSDPEVARYYYDLGEQYRGLAETAPDDAARRKDLQSAVEAYQKVPASAKVEYLPSRYRALSARVEMTLAMPADAPDRLATAKKLISNLQTFSAEILKTPGEPKSPATRKEWSLLTAFDAQRLRYEIPSEKGEQDAALREIRQLVQKADGTDAQSIIARYEITKLIGQNDTQQAIERVKWFMERFPKKATALIARMIEQIQVRIDVLQQRDDPASKQQLDQYCKAYLEFATVLYEDAKGLSPEKAYGYKQLYADALLKNGRVDEALAQFKECAKLDEQGRDVRIQRINQEFAAKTKALEAASGNVDQVVALANAYLESVAKDYGLRVDRDRWAAEVKTLLEFLEEGATPGEKQGRLPALVRALRNGYDSLAETARRNVPVDATNILGLARAYRAKGDYTEAVKYYNMLAGGLSPEDTVLYWKTQLERCQTYLAAARKSTGDERKTRAENLLIIIKQLDAIDKTKGNLYTQFNIVENEANRLLKQ